MYQAQACFQAAAQHGQGVQLGFGRPVRPLQAGVFEVGRHHALHRFCVSGLGSGCTQLLRQHQRLGGGQ